MKNHFRPRYHHFVALAPHLLDQNGDLHLASSMNFECTGCFGIVDLQGDIAARLANESLADMSRGNKFSVTAGKGRIVHENSHPDGGWIDIDKLKRGALLAIGQGLADVDVLESGQPDNFTGGGLFGLDLLETGIGEKRSDIGAFMLP